MTDEEADAIQARHREATEAFDLREMSVTGTLVEEDIPALLAERMRLREALTRIFNRYQAAKGTPLLDYWGLPWAMMQDAREALESTADTEETDGKTS